MSGDRPATDPGAEREIDLRKWRDALLARWWIAAAGLVVGIVIGALYSLSGGSTFNATARIAPGEEFNPSGSSQVLTYLTSEAAINEIVTSQNALQVAAKKAGIGVGQLRGHVTTTAVDENTGQPTSATTRNAVLIDITVQLGKATKAEDAANALATFVQTTTTSKYVSASLKIIATQISNFKRRLITEQKRIAAISAALAQPNLGLTEGVLLNDDNDTATADYDATQTALLGEQQQQILAEQVETTQIILPAVAQKTTARSRRDSVLVGAVIGIILGAIVAMYIGLRGPRPAARVPV